MGTQPGANVLILTLLLFGVKRSLNTHQSEAAKWMWKWLQFDKEDWYLLANLSVSVSSQVYVPCIKFWSITSGLKGSTDSTVT